ncbi:MAG: hypothetical protein WCT20_00260 [Candidatus Babeliales bacterium]
MDFIAALLISILFPVMIDHHHKISTRHGQPYIGEAYAENFLAAGIDQTHFCAKQAR